MDEVTGLDSDKVNPAHYRRGNYELIDILEAWGLHKNGHLFSVAQYIFRALHKEDFINDCKKAIWYTERAIEKYIEETPLTDLPNLESPYCYSVGLGQPRKEDKIDMSDSMAEMLRFGVARRKNGWDAPETCPFCRCLSCHKSCEGYRRQQYLLGCDKENAPNG